MWGGCFVVSKIANGTPYEVDDVMCKLKKHLIDLALKFKYKIKYKDPEVYCTLKQKCLDKLKGNFTNQKLTDLAKKTKNIYSFEELKEIYYNNNKLFNKLVKKYEGF